MILRFDEFFHGIDIFGNDKRTCQNATSNEIIAV